MTTREIEGHSLEIYGVEVSSMLVSQVTEALLAEVQTRQNRPLEKFYLLYKTGGFWPTVLVSVSDIASHFCSHAGDAGGQNIITKASAN